MNTTEKFWDKQAKKYDVSEQRFEPVFEKIFIKTKKHLKKVISS